MQLTGRELYHVPIWRLVLLVPVKVEYPIKEVLSRLQDQASSFRLLLPLWVRQDCLGLVRAEVGSEAHLTAVLNDWVRLGSQVKLSPARVVDPDLVRLDQNLGVNR